MSTCPDCNQNRMTSRGCTLAYFVIDGEKHKRVTGSYEKGKSFTKEVTQGEEKQCPDCGAIEGNVHHFGCENELCPIHKTPLIACDCDMVRASA
ncbi:MAG TPA: hypothetical protein PLB51_03040 [Candidatus Paceibacterota bacterium]|nr:hypothetical protein [Candidatus Paceibacterota bacterium]